MILKPGHHEIDLATPCVMGILNVTPDSFYDGGRVDHDAALAHARQMIADGARIIDVGGESTRPGAEAVDEQEELCRVAPIVELLAREGACVSVDTMKPAVMRAALDAGAAMVNDVRALQAPGAIEVAAASDAAVCLMHMQGEPATMQRAPAYADVVAEVRGFLARRAQACLDAGIAAFKKRHFAKAKAEFEKAESADPQSAAAAYYLGYTYYKIGEPSKRMNANKEKAKELFAKAFSLDPAFTPTWGRKK